MKLTKLLNEIQINKPGRFKATYEDDGNAPYTAMYKSDQWLLDTTAVDSKIYLYYYFMGEEGEYDWEDPNDWYLKGLKHFEKAKPIVIYESPEDPENSARLMIMDSKYFEFDINPLEITTLKRLEDGWITKDVLINDRVPINEIQINSPGNKPYSKYKQLIDEIFNRKFIENLAELDSFDPVEILTSNDEGIENAFTTFILNHMVRNNYEIDGQIVSHNSQIEESDIIKYVESKPKLKQALIKLIYKFYLEKVLEIKAEFKRAMVKAINYAPDSYQPSLSEYEIEREVTWEMHKLEDYYYIDYVDDIISDCKQEFEQYLLNILGLKPLEEITINKPGKVFEKFKDKIDDWVYNIASWSDFDWEEEERIFKAIKQKDLEEYNSMRQSEICDLYNDDTDGSVLSRLSHVWDDYKISPNDETLEQSLLKNFPDE
jgi:hypothetical protein